jgi:O-antigen ligase
MLYTYTRSVWIAGGLAVVIAIAGNPATRKFLVPLALAGGVAVVIAFTVVPGGRDAAEERASDERPVWDRKNLSNAALNAFKDHPLTGVGYGQFGAKIDTLLTQADTFPLTGAQTQAHNLFLSQLAETGLVGFVPWILAFVLAIVMPALRRGPPHLRPWRQGLQMYAAAWLVVAMLTPMALAFPNYLLWLLAGIVAAPHTSWPLDADRAATRRRVQA